MYFRVRKQEWCYAGLVWPALSLKEEPSEGAGHTRREWYSTVFGKMYTLAHDH